MTDQPLPEGRLKALASIFAKVEREQVIQAITWNSLGQEVIALIAELRALRQSNEAPTVGVSLGAKGHDWRLWLARQLNDPMLTDDEAAGIVAFHPRIKDARQSNERTEPSLHILQRTPAAAPAEPSVGWDDLKVAFGVEDVEPLWLAWEAGKLLLPEGWSLCETDCSGARCVAVFRVEGVIPTTADALKVKAQIAAMLAASPAPSHGGKEDE